LGAAGLRGFLSFGFSSPFAPAAGSRFLGPGFLRPVVVVVEDEAAVVFLAVVAGAADSEMCGLETAPPRTRIVELFVLELPLSVDERAPGE
jgi:hypothetical protein